VSDGSRWTYGGPWEVLWPRELGALPPGSVRTFDLDGILVSLHKHEDGSWRFTPRTIPTFLLHGRASRERVRAGASERKP